MPANISPYLLFLILLILILILILLPAFSPRACTRACMHVRVACVYVCVYLYKKIPPPPYMREVVDYPPAPTPSFSLSFFSSTLAPLLRFARTVISYLYLSPPTTYTPPSSRRTTGIISVFPQTRLTRNVVQQALRALSTGRDILFHPAALSRSLFLWLSTRLDSTRLRRLIIHD